MEAIHQRIANAHDDAELRDAILDAILHLAEHLPEERFAAFASEVTKEAATSPTHIRCTLEVGSPTLSEDELRDVLADAVHFILESVPRGKVEVYEVRQETL